MGVVVPQDGFQIDLTPQGMSINGFAGIVAGDDYGLRLAARVADDTAAIDLTGALVIFTVRKTDASPSVLFQRRSDTAITGLPSILQVALDDQTTDNGPDGTSGRGWYQVNFGNTEEAAVLALVSTTPLRFDVRAKLANGQVLTLARGIISALHPDTNPVV